MSKIDLREMVGGALQDKFQHSFERVMENLQDRNTPFKDKREIIIKMTFAQNEQRDNVVASVKVTEKLASQGELTTQFAMGKDLRTGEVIAEEYGNNQLKGQMALDTKVAKVDMETGEVLEEETVVDFRKVKGE
ncbi:putative uncharacterized protein [Firmicutes bacterium CAG:238]|nr:putative uncharacterized protein [Firmicutes bacterium CAG:238]